ALLRRHDDVGDAALRPGRLFGNGLCKGRPMGRDKGENGCLARKAAGRKLRHNIPSGWKPAYAASIDDRVLTFSAPIHRARRASFRRNTPTGRFAWHDRTCGGASNATG